MQLLADVPLLAPWTTFYEIVGCSGGALVGLQFVVIALVANTRGRADYRAINAFGTPNVVHFAAVLVISSLMAAPWPTEFAVSIAIGVFGAVGLGYSVSVFRRAGHQTAYKPVLEDWIFYTIIPCVIYSSLPIAAYLLNGTATVGTLMIGGAALSLLLVGIRNAWDSVTHIVTDRDGNREKTVTSPDHE